MELIQFITAIGMGAIATKTMDFWLQDKLQRQQRTTWLRDQRLQAFTDVTREMISFGLHKENVRSAFEIYGAMSKALLLLDDDGLVRRIDSFVSALDKLTELSKSVMQKDLAEAEALYSRLVIEAREITMSLRNVILHDRILNR